MCRGRGGWSVDRPPRTRVQAPGEHGRTRPSPEASSTTPSLLASAPLIFPRGLQVRVADQDARVAERPGTGRRPWAVAWVGLAVAFPVALLVLDSPAESVHMGALLALVLGLVAVESFN